MLKAKVKRHGRIIKHSIKSSIWIGIKVVHRDLLDNTKWIIGNGKEVNVWLDDWLGTYLANKYKIPEIYHRTMVSKFSDWWDSNGWNISSNTLSVFPSLPSLLAGNFVVT